MTTASCSYYWRHRSHLAVLRCTQPAAAHTLGPESMKQPCYELVTSRQGRAPGIRPVRRSQGGGDDVEGSRLLELAATDGTSMSGVGGRLEVL
jgi:hypothetical protein